MQSIPTVKRDSPVKKYPGSVELPVYLTAPEVLMWNNVIAEYDRLIAEAKAKDNTVSLEAALAMSKVWEGGICQIVRAWNIKGLPDHLTAAQFPTAPRVAADALRSWLIEQITELYFVENEVPNE